MQKEKQLIPLLPDGSVDAQECINIWTRYLPNKSKKNTEIINRAVDLARLIGEDKANPYGFSCFMQGLETASIISELGVDEETIAAALLYGCVQYADLSLDDIEESVNASVKKLVVGVQQMEIVHLTHGRLLQSTEHSASIDNLRKMMLAMVEDVRVVLIKLAERLCILKHVAHFKVSERKRLANETMIIFAPLANRLGVWHLKWPLEDYAFRYLENDKYKSLAKVIDIHRSHREEYVAKAIDKLKSVMNDAGIQNIEISGRAKHIYSIYSKMKRKNVGINKIYDIVALRVLVDSIEDCYAALSAINAHWSPIKEEFDDYIAHPKKNGYQSLHTAVKDKDGNYFEIQIRTHEMHKAAELGVAAHWIYKENKKEKSSSYEAKIAWLRQLIGWQKEISSQDEKEKEAYSHIFDDRIYVFTPKGEVIDLPKGATVLDFAYHIHSDIGNRCRGAKIDEKMVPLKYQLKMGDKIEVIIDNKHTPSRDWLIPTAGYLFTAKARAKVNHWFRQQGFDAQVSIGEELFEKEHKRSGLKTGVNDIVLKHFNYKTKADLLAALGRGDLRIGVVLNYIRDQEKPKKKIKAKKVVPKKKVVKKQSDIIIGGMGNLLTNIAGCCKPMPGDKIVGYVTLGKGVSVHRQSCISLQTNKQKNPNRVVSAKWGNASVGSYTTDLILSAQPTKNIAREITGCITDVGASVVGLNTSEKKPDELLKIRLTIELNNLDELDGVIKKLQHLPGIVKVRRT